MVTLLGPSYPVACRIFLDQGLNLSLLHWQVDSQPLGHQSRPLLRIFLFESHKLSKSKTRFNNLFLNWLSLLFPYSLVVFSNFDLSVNGFHCFHVERYSFSLRCFYSLAPVYCSNSIFGFMNVHFRLPASLLCLD